MGWWYHLDILNYKTSLVEIPSYKLKEQFLKVISTLKIIVTYSKNKDSYRALDIKTYETILLSGAVLATAESKVEG